MIRFTITGITAVFTNYDKQWQDQYVWYSVPVPPSKYHIHYIVAVTAPSIDLWLLHHTSPHGIVVDVSTYL